MDSSAAPSSVDLRFRHACGALEEIEIAAFVGLPDMARENSAVSAGAAGSRPFPGLAPSGEFRFVDFQVQGSFRDVELDRVAAPHPGERAPDPRFRGDAPP